MIETIMRQYELMLVLRTDAAANDEKAQRELVSTLVGEGATITEFISLGKKRLAYPIRKQPEGVYLLTKLASASLTSAGIQKRAKLDESVLRFLLTAQA